MAYNKIQLKLKCEWCGKDFEILKSVNHRRKKNNTPDLCEDCIKIHRNKIISEKQSKIWNNKTEEELKQISDLHRDIWYNQSDDVKDKILNLAKDGYQNYLNNMTDEQKKNISKMHRKDTLDYYATRTEEQKIKHNENLSKAKEEEWKNMNDDEKNKRLYALHIGGENYRRNMTEEEKKIQNKLMINGRNEWLKNLTDEERIYYITKLSLSLQESWDLMTPEEREERSELIKQGMKNMSDEAKEQMHENQKIAAIKRYKDPEEHEKISRAIRLGKANMSPENRKQMIQNSFRNKDWYNQLHRKFEIYFKESELSKHFYYDSEIYVNNNSIGHLWDYGIYNKYGELELLLDLDGVFYHADDKYDYNGIQSHEEYDEIRYLSIPNNIKSCIIYELKFDESFEYLINILKLSYDEFIKNKHEYFKNIKFPYPQYNDKELKYSYEQLCKLDNDDTNHKNKIFLNVKLGNHLIYHFHPSIFKDHYNDKLSPYDIWNDNKSLMNLMNYAIRFINASRSKLIINKYLNDYDLIFNPYDKYSGIMLGSLSLNKQYIGLNENIDILNESYNMIHFLQKYFKIPQVNIYNKNILSHTGSYPCLFTSLSLHDDSDKFINECLLRFDCNKYVFVINDTHKYKNNVVEKIYNRNYYDEYIILINK